jgi:hypothetical protein
MERHSRQLVELLTTVDPMNSVGNSIDTAENAAYLLFRLIAKYHGKDEAYRIFSIWSGPPSASRKAAIRNAALLDLYDVLQETYASHHEQGISAPKPSVRKLAQMAAEWNKELPREEQRGAGAKNATTLEDHIRQILKKRRRRRRERI